MRRRKKRSEARKVFEDLLADSIRENYKDVDPDEWLYVHDGDAFSEAIRSYAAFWDEARALVDALEHSHQDPAFDPEKNYHVLHKRATHERFRMRRDGTGDPDALIQARLTRSMILKRLSEIAQLDFGDKPDVWRSWFTAYDEDDFFPPVR